MENFLKKPLKTVGKIARVAALAGSVLVIPAGAKADIPKDISSSTSTAEMENHRHDKVLLKSIEKIEEQFKSLSSKEITVDKPAYVIMSESEILNNQMSQSEKVMNDKYIAERLLNDAIDNSKEKVTYVVRDSSMASALERENSFQNDGLVDPSEIKEHNYIRPAAYIVISQKNNGAHLIFYANIIYLNTKNTKALSVSENLFQVSPSMEVQENMLKKLEQLISEEIKIGEALK